MANVQAQKISYGGAGIVSQPDFGEAKNGDTLIKLAAATGAASPGFAGYLAKGVEAGVGGLMETATAERNEERRLAYELKKQAALKSMEQMDREWALEHGQDEVSLYRKKREADMDLERVRQEGADRKLLEKKEVARLVQGTQDRFLMTAKKNPDKVDYVVAAAERAGLDPSVALAVWGQESDFNTDPTFKSKVPTKYGYATSPFQITPGNWPEIENAKTFEQQADLFVKILKEKGVRGYFGEGVDANGMNTDKYEEMVRLRGDVLLGILAEGDWSGEGGFSIAAKGKKTDPATTPLPPRPDVPVTDNLSPREERAAAAGFGVPQSEPTYNKDVDPKEWPNIDINSKYHRNTDPKDPAKEVARDGETGEAIRVGGKWFTQPMYEMEYASKAHTRDKDAGKTPLDKKEYMAMARAKFKLIYDETMKKQGASQ
jgi:hypothetical protein